jgi:RNA polymerase sigma-70 factor (ECF subfamily)
MFTPQREPAGSMEAVCEVGDVSATGAASAVEQAREGDVVAFERLYRENVGRIHAVCLRLSGDPALAEELTQDVFVRAWEKLDSFRGDSAFSTWLHRLAVNVVLGQRRTDGRRHARVLATDDPESYEIHGVAPSDVGARMDLDRAMAELPAASRTVFVMHDVEGFTHEEIAQLTGRAEGTCKALLHRARRALRERLT